MKMNYYEALIEYDGTGYFGFQWQKDIPSIQHDFNQALGKIVLGKITTMGASRTDTGVHALGQVVKITSENPIDCSNFSVLLNNALPSQMRCIQIAPCRGDFRPSAHHQSKEYRYFFTNDQTVSPENQKFISNCPMKLNFDSIRTCVKALQGVHDFRNFCSAGSNIKSTVREIIVCELTEVTPSAILSESELFKVSKDLRCYQLQIEGNGFLKQMIRHLVSALWMVGSGKLTVEDFINLLNGPMKEKRIWKVAPPFGLFLYQIKYPKS